jgi:probable rRNA maturation factor
MKKKTPDKNVISDPPCRTSIAVNINISCDTVRFDRHKIIEMVQKVTGQFGTRKARINFIVLDDKEITKLNRNFLNKTGTTDVISFDLSDKADGLNNFDIAVNAEMAQRQAKTRDHKPESELALYLLHGLLHNLGFDDSTAGKAAKMHKTEDDILQKFGYGIVYNRKR